jgi:hypothetical protein
VHAEPIDSALCGAATSPPHVESRVAGFGAPVSVRIRLGECEIPRLRAQVLELLEAARTGAQSIVDEETAAPRVLAWEAMLDQLEPCDATGGLDLLWPTALALRALRAAADDALDALADAPRGIDDLDALAELVYEAAAAIETLRALVAVDLGGLQEVAL